VLAEEALATSDGERHDDAITPFQVGDLGAHVLHDPHELVAQRHGPELGEEAVVDVKIRAADRGARHAHDGVAWLDHARIGDVFDADVLRLVKYGGFHRCPPAVPHNVRLVSSGTTGRCGLMDAV
jgi:hypothetical protein